MIPFPAWDGHFDIRYVGFVSLEKLSSFLSLSLVLPLAYSLCFSLQVGFGSITYFIIFILVSLLLSFLGQPHTFQDYTNDLKFSYHDNIKW